MTAGTAKKSQKCSSSRRKAPSRREPALFEFDMDAQRTRAKALLGREIEFIANAEFRQRNAEKKILTSADKPSASGRQGKKSTLPKDLPAHLARLCEARLLTADEERDLFRRMNYLKYRANVLRCRLDPAKPDTAAMDEMERLMVEANAVRDRIVKANMRLVISIVKKFVTPKHSFDDLLSDGIESLMHAVSKFDYHKGFRFSTYAYRAIARNAYRTIADQHKADSRVDASTSEDLVSLPQEDRSSSLGEHEWMRMRSLLGSMMQRLDRRERFILRGRFALGAHRKVRTFQCLAEKLGVSKERVRQLEQRAITKLQTMAAEIDLEA
jgi:RNA polymerase primary sigma factor